jgi:hypothetical protein
MAPIDAGCSSKLDIELEYQIRQLNFFSLAMEQMISVEESLPFSRTNQKNKKWNMVG